MQTDKTPSTRRTSETADKRKRGPEAHSPRKSKYTLSESKQSLEYMGYRIAASGRNYFMTSAITGIGGIRWHFSCHVPDGKDKPLLMLCVWYGPGDNDWVTQTLGGTVSIGDAATLAAKLADKARAEANALGGQPSTLPDPPANTADMLTGYGGAKLLDTPKPQAEYDATHVWYVMRYHSGKREYLATTDPGPSWVSRYDWRKQLTYHTAQSLAYMYGGTVMREG